MNNSVNYSEKVNGTRKFINTSNTVMGHASGLSMTPTVALMSKSVISTAGPEQSSTMIEKEKRAIEKIKLR